MFNHFINNKLVNFLTWLVLGLVLVSLFLSQKWMYVFNAWDTGNVINFGLNAFNNKVPNIDYISGYPGGYDYLIASFYRLFGVGIISYQILIGAASYSLFLVSYSTISRYISYPIAMVLSFFVFFVSVYSNWEVSPGTIVQLISMAVLFVLLIWFNNKNVWLLLVIGLLCGIALLYKQSAIFICVAVILALTYEYLNFPSRIINRIFIIFPSLLLFFGYYFVRFHMDAAPVINHLALLPWVVSIGYLTYLSFYNASVKKQIVVDSKLSNKFYKNIIVFSFGVVAGLAFSLKIYDVDQLNFVFNEIFFRMPSLIDRDINSLPLHKNTLKELFIILILFIPIMLAGDFIKVENKYSRFLIKLIFIISLLMLAYNVFNRNQFWPYRLLVSGEVLIWFQIIVTPLIIVLSFITNKIKKESIFICLYFSMQTVIAWPYPSAEHIVAPILLSLFLYLFINLNLKEKQLFSFSFKYKVFISFICLLLVFAGSRDIFKESFVYTEDKLVFIKGAKFTSEREKHLTRLAHFLKDKVPEGDSITGYPNLAYSIVASGNNFGTKQGNYIGNDKEDLDIYIADILSNKIEWVILNETNWPYNDHPYFFDSQIIATRIKEKYKVVERFNQFVLYKYMR